ncbi:MAG: Rho termination factor N-terminal domain-containing protein, partial [Parasporobacterium sp.]|nr:Rho termination factor N-terminal domain-containing protein [Parasporobacterium sp.]
MRKKLESLPLVQLKAIAKQNGIKGASTMKKADVIEAILQMSEEKKREEETGMTKEEENKLDSGKVAHGILEVLPDGYGFIRCANYMPGDEDVYVSPSQIKRFGLKTGDILLGKVRVRTQNEKFGALLHLDRINGYLPSEAVQRKNFEDLTPIFPEERMSLETSEKNLAMRIFDLVSPIGKGQRGMIVSPPKAGKTTLLKGVARSILKNNPEV